MPPHPPSRTTPAPRVGRGLAVVVLALALTAADAALALRGHRPGSVAAPDPVWLPALRTGAAGVLLLVLAGVVGRRAGVLEREHEVWRHLARAMRCTALGLAVQSGVAAATAAGVLAPHPLTSLPFALASLLGCAVMYQGLITWNRVRTTTADTSDWLNGISAVLAVVAIGLLVVAAAGLDVDGWAAWQLQGWLLRLGAGVVLLGAAATVALMTALHRDPRMALVLASPAALLAGTVVGALVEAPGGTAGHAEVSGWVVAGALVCAASLVPARVVEHRPASNQEATVGSAVVIAAGVVVLVLDTRLGGAAAATCTGYSLVAVVGAGARVWHVLRDLDALATTRQQALTDDLTGAANRRALGAHLTGAIPGGATLLVLDLDGFKQVNDRWGHGVGDELLRVVTRRLRAVLPPGAMLARLGGDEFAVVVPGGAAPGRDLAATVVDALAVPVVVDGHRSVLSASVGLAHSAPPREPVPAQELLRRADAAMYVAKAAGGSQVRAYDGAVDAAAGERARLAEDLRAMLGDAGSGEVGGGQEDAGGALLVHYQPQLDILGSDVVGVEALVRWQHPRLGLVPPDDFLPLAEQLGLMVELTARVLTRAAADATTWPGRPPSAVGPAGPAPRLAVNLSASCLGHPRLLPLLRAVLARHPGLAGRLVLEVTETAIMADPDVALAAMDQLCALGVDFSIDDYGTGFASLAYLHDLPAVELKLDRSFTARLSGGGRTAAIVAGTVELAHQLGMRLVAEGVEDAETLAALAQLGCDETQGWFHARPMPAGELLDWFAAHRSASGGAPPAGRTSGSGGHLPAAAPVAAGAVVAGGAVPGAVVVG